MPIETVVLDFDGTFTDVDTEAAPYAEAYRHELEDLLGRTVTQLWEEEEGVIRSRPAEFGWILDSKVVAPASADPYVLATAVTQRIFDRLGLLSSVSLRADIFQALYRSAYHFTAVAFRPEAREVLEALLASPVNVFVVTNAHTETVEQKLDALAPKGRERLQVFGDSKKHVVADAVPSDERFAQLPEWKRVPGLESRPVFLRRGRYYELLRKLWTATGTSPERTLVCGDIWELDLAMPQELGTAVHLIERRTTLDYERRAVAALGSRGGVSPTLRPLVERVLASRAPRARAS